MANQFLMEILTPERSFYCDTIDAVIVPAPDGDMSIHKGHENMVLYLVPGEMRILKDKKWQFCSV
ncbi:MAG: F0F1 ATP synthase subunit epsilon, partial [Oribacterium sp.]|nr:F0F1 ATP synthase subunit epsilon [Oribacterium sp.]